MIAEAQSASDGSVVAAVILGAIVLAFVVGGLVIARSARRSRKEHGVDDL
ncbi:hypothetical protein HC251_24760 (plasmid) [Iamia sp. SCSIO 61187]|nr:hypothetical protein [Iamia sp. SCSIO 61187]QYG94341.1 hypothetical protein HC251_19160 [Iamia sp. SCSIO 61187]QYG95766.1 hypothetical protein HC251_24760 [Iamia sp. SCSIO 61187]